MPKHLSNLKDVYKKTYEELKNPKSPIGVFEIDLGDFFK